MTRDPARVLHLLKVELREYIARLKAEPRETERARGQLEALWHVRTFLEIRERLKG